MLPRIPPLEKPFPEEVADDLAAMMPAGVDPIALFRTLARSPRILRKVRAGNLLDRGPLDRRERELVILRTTARCGSEYEWGVHASIFARRYGLSEDAVAGSVSADADAPCWDDRQRVLVRLVDELHETASLSEPLWQELAKGWSPEQILELLALAGCYRTIAYFTNALGVPLEPAAERFPPTP